MSKETLNIVKKFLNTYSIETTPNVYSKYGDFSEFLNKKHDIYITYLPDEEPNNVIDTAKSLLGYEPKYDISDILKTAYSWYNK